MDLFDPDFHDEPRTQLEQLESDLLELNFPQDEIDQVSDASAISTDDEVRTAVERSNELIADGNKEAEIAARDAERDARRRDFELSKSNVNLSSVLSASYRIA